MVKKEIVFNILTVLVSSIILANCSDAEQKDDNSYLDQPFVQEYHVGYKLGENVNDNDVRSIAVDSSQNIWAATKTGIYVKPSNKENWSKIEHEFESGPSFSIEVDSENNVWFSTWNGIYKYNNGYNDKIDEVPPPINKIIATTEGVYAFGYNGVWIIKDEIAEKIDIVISKGVRDAISDNKGGLWIASDVGLYHYNPPRLELYQDPNELISCYTSSISRASDNSLWVGGLGGVTIRSDNRVIKTLRAEQGIPSEEVRCIERSPSGNMWVGTSLGIVRYYKTEERSLRFSNRWLLSDEVRDIKFDNFGTAWIATSAGVSSIKRRDMTLAQKANYFYNRLMKRHVREPWIVHRVGLKIEGDTSSWYPLDDDNDGEYTGIYLSMESLRYAATGDIDGKEKAKKAFHTLKYFQEVTETEGFFARTVIPIDWKSMNDPNRKYTQKEHADELVNDPRFKHVENRWRKSKNGKWLWKGDTSSDEMCGHFMGYYYYYEFAADEEEKENIRSHIKKIMDYVIKHNYNLVDIDGKPTRWAVWSPDKLNRDPDWASERSLNSFEILAFLKFTYYATGDEKYQDKYLYLINEEHYLDNVALLNDKNPAWEIYFDIPMAGYLFPLLIKCEEDPKLKLFYENIMDEWFENQISGNNPLNNFIYCYVRDKRLEIQNSIGFLIDTPLDLVDWKIDHTTREDIRIVREPILEEKQINILPPASERATVRWDKNPWAAIQGSSYSEREPVFWLFPYWMGKYLKIIED